MTVKAILSRKGGDVVTIAPTATLSAAVKLLAERRIGAILVTGPDNRVAGILSERDIVRAVALSGSKALDRPVREFMTASVRTCAPRDTEAELMALMTEHRVRHLPVVEGGKLGGMISIGDVVKNRIEEIEREAEEMKSYIASSG